MSNYEFLTKLDSVLRISDPVYLNGENFVIAIEERKGWHSAIIVFDKDGNFLWENWRSSD